MLSKVFPKFSNHNWKDLSEEKKENIGGPFCFKGLEYPLVESTFSFKTSSLTL